MRNLGEERSTPVIARRIINIGLAIIVCTLAACATGAGAPADENLYRPPTQVAGDTLIPPQPTLEEITPSPTPAELRPTSTPECTPGLTFLEDLTLPDGSVVAPGEQLDKRWRVENSGTCNWNQNYKLVHVGGPQLGLTPDQPLYPARSGTQADLQLIFTAPQESGVYRSAWQAQDLHGNAFGDQIFIEIQIAAP